MINLIMNLIIDCPWLITSVACCNNYIIWGGLKLLLALRWTVLFVVLLCANTFLPCVPHEHGSMSKHACWYWLMPWSLYLDNMYFTTLWRCYRVWCHTKKCDNENKNVSRHVFIFGRAVASYHTFSNFFFCKNTPKWSLCHKLSHPTLFFFLAGVARDNFLAERTLTLFATQFAQIALVTLTCHLEDMCSKGLVQPDAAFTGHSLGEFSALAPVADILPNSSLVDIYGILLRSGHSARCRA